MPFRSFPKVDAVETVDRAAEEAIRTTGIEARLILCTLRHFSRDQSLETARLLERFSGSRVVALDLAADEAGHPIDAHVPAFRWALERGYARTAHAGEATRERLRTRLTGPPRR